MPFKNGAFHTAYRAEVDVVPVCVSELHGKIKMNCWNNGVLKVAFLEPVRIANYQRENLRELSAHCHQKMDDKIKQLNASIEQEQ
ncbi:1-acyl-sn-glycerol-3-phosphate acyltransferase, partial [Psychrobacter sp. SIMBA_152]